MENTYLFIPDAELTAADIVKFTQYPGEPFTYVVQSEMVTDINGEQKEHIIEAVTMKVIEVSDYTPEIDTIYNRALDNHNQKQKQSSKLDKTKLKTNQNGAAALTQTKGPKYHEK